MEQVSISHFVEEMPEPAKDEVTDLILLASREAGKKLLGFYIFIQHKTLLG